MNNKFTLKHILLLFTCLVFLSVKSGNADEVNQIVVTGQVVTTTHGTPLVGHKVYIKNDSIGLGGLVYFKELKTDEYGFYYDTINTTFMDGTILVYTYDFKNLIESADVHFRFLTGENDNVFVNDFSVFMPVMSPGLQARFQHSQDTINNRFKFSFFDQTDNDHILERVWDFGDQVSTNIENPVHVYQEPGFYRVSLTVTAVVDNRTEKNTISRFIFIPVNVYYDLGGNCFADLFPLENGMTYLYLKDSNNKVWPVDTASVNKQGIYYFYQVPVGDYTIKVKPTNKSPHYGEMMPTYFGGELFWDDATFFHHDKKSYDYDIYLENGMGVEDGEGSISGVVMIDEYPSNLLTTTQNVDVYLFNTKGETLSSHYTDENSEFTFDNIAYGTYYISPEITGVPRNETRIIITEDLPEVSSITINAETGEVTLDVFETKSFGKVEFDDLYPNPASNQVNLSLNLLKTAETAIEIIDMNGRVVQVRNLNLKSGQNTIALPVTNLENGIYFLRLQIDNEYGLQKFIVSK